MFIHTKELAWRKQDQSAISTSSKSFKTAI